MRSSSRYSSESLAEAVNFQIANAQGYIRMGKERDALEHLHDFIKSRRQHMYEKKSFEKLMLFYMELCVKRQEHRLAKDGLYQLRSLCQNTDPKSLENVINALLKMAEDKAEEARQKADDRALTEAAKIPDLEDDEIFDQNLLDAYEEGLKSQTDKEIVVPWRKFRWEMYRSVMELLAKNPKFHDLYHATCKAAFAFCKDYERHREFKHLSEMLSKHLQELERQQAPGKQKMVFEWSPDMVRLHLDTRCAQLKVATELELWNEAFKIVGDIDKILSKEACTPEVMQDKLGDYQWLLAKLFQASEDYPYHASALYAHFTLAREQAKQSADAAAKLPSLASVVLLAALSIPRLEPKDAKRPTDGNDSLEYAAKVLRFNVRPTRTAVLADFVSKGMLVDVYPELQQLHHALEVKFDPLGMVKAVMPAIQFIRNSGDNSLTVYLPLLEKVVVLRLIAQLSTVYSELRIAFVRNLLAPLSMPFFEMEKLLVNAVHDGSLNLRMDHKNGCIKFIEGTTAVHTMHGQLYRVATKLQLVSQRIHAHGDVEASTASRRRFLDTVFQAAEEEHRLLVDRMELIEKRSDTLRRQEERRRLHEQQQKEEEESKRKADEKMRLAKEQSERERERQEEVQRAAQARKVQDLFNKMGRQIDTAEAKRLVAEGRHKEELQEQQKKQVRAEEQRRKKLATQFQKLDYLTRAIRMEEAPILQRDIEESMEQDLAIHQKCQEEEHAARQKQHAHDVLLKQQFAPLQAFRAEFERSMVESQKPQFLARLKKHRERNIEQARKARERAEEEALMAMQRRAAQEEEAAREREAREEARRVEAEAAQAQREADAAREEDNWRREPLHEEEPSRGPRDDEGWQVARQGGAPREGASEPWRPSRMRNEAAGSDNYPPRSRDEPSSWRGRGGDDAPPRRDFGEGPPRRDFGEGPPRRDFADGPRRDFGDRPRRDFGEGPPRRDFGDDRRRDFGEGPPRRDFGDDRRRDFGEGPPRRDFGDDRRRDFGEGPPRRDFGDDRRGDRRDGPDFRRERRFDGPPRQTNERQWR